MIIVKSDVLLDEHKMTVLVKESESNYGSDNDKLDSPTKIVDALNHLFHVNRKAEEYLYLICLTTKCHPISVFEVSHGTCDATYVRGRELLIRALLCGASNVVIVHNHPSGDPEPSTDDMMITNQLQKACGLVGIELEDHIIIAGDGYYSFRERNHTNLQEMEAHNEENK